MATAETSPHRSELPLHGTLRSDRAVFSLSVDVDGGEESENARVISPTARDTTGPKEAASFAARSIRFACVMAVIGVAVAVLPLCLTAHEGGRQLTANVWELDLGSSSTTTNSTATPFIWLRATSMNPASWTGKQREHLDAPVAAILPFWACAYASFAATFVLSPWLVVRSWHANEATKSGTIYVQHRRPSADECVRARVSSDFLFLGINSRLPGF